MLCSSLLQRGLPAQCALLPLFYEKSATPAMIKHGLDIQRRAIEWINPGRIPVTTIDQPLVASKACTVEMARCMW